MDQRSALAKLCRAQVYPPRGSRLYEMTKPISIHFQQTILPLCQTPLLAGLVLQLVLLAPLTQRDVDTIYKQSLEKELTVMESVMRTCELDFEPFFGMYYKTIHWSVAPNPKIARYVHERIDNWIRSLQNRVLYPRIGSKTVSTSTASEVRKIDPDYVQENEIGITPIDLERIYHRHNIKVSGSCEMRQKWYYSNLQPRTYYAQGGDAFHSSKYLANPFVDLCDTIPATNRRTRVDPNRIVIPNPTSDIAYYDLTSFTSNLHVQRTFMYRLAKYCEGVKVSILDSVRGVISQDLGELIHEYTRVNLHYPSYTLPSKYADSSLVHYHNIAGFLGVYGNIATATFIHGIVMAMRHDNLDENNVAGDDGLDVTESVEDTLALVQSLGTVKDEKTFRDKEGCCIHLKRPIRRIGNRLFHGHLVSWPSLEPGQSDVDPRYPYLKRMSNRDRKDAIAGSVTAFLRKLEHQDLSDNDIEIVDTFLSSLYDTYDLPRGGCVPQITQSNSGFVPIYEKRFIGMDPISNTITRLYDNIARVPQRGVIKLDADDLHNTTFMCNSTKMLRHLVMLGYLEQEKIHSYVFGYNGLERLLKEYIDPEPPVYQYNIVYELPVWAQDHVF